MPASPPPGAPAYDVYQLVLHHDSQDPNLKLRDPANLLGDPPPPPVAPALTPKTLSIAGATPLDVVEPAGPAYKDDGTKKKGFYCVGALPNGGYAGATDPGLGP